MVGMPRDSDRINFKHSSQSGRVSIIVVCYNSLEDVRNLSPTIDDQTYDDVETIFVLNDGDPSTVEFLEGTDHEYIIPPDNLWYSGGNDFGAEHATGEYIFVLSPDTELAPDAIETVVEQIERFPDAGAIAPMVLQLRDGERTDDIDSFGMQFNHVGYYNTIAKGKPQTKFDGPSDVAAFDGPAVLFRRTAIEDVGLFDRRFKFLQETVDLGLRLHESGWRIVAVPCRCVWHEGRTSTSKQERTTLENTIGVRNDYLLHAKNTPFTLAAFYVLYHTYLNVSDAIGFATSGEVSSAVAILKGVLWGVYSFLGELPSDSRLERAEWKELQRFPEPR